MQFLKGRTLLYCKSLSRTFIKLPLFDKEIEKEDNLAGNIIVRIAAKVATIAAINMAAIYMAVNNRVMVNIKEEEEVMVKEKVDNGAAVFRNFTIAPSRPFVEQQHE